MTSFLRLESHREVANATFRTSLNNITNYPQIPLNRISYGDGAEVVILKGKKLESLDPLYTLSTAITVIGIIVGVFQLRISGKKDFAGSFFSFRTERDRKNRIILDRIVYCCGIIFFSLYILINVSAFIDFIPGLTNERSLNICAMIIMMVMMISNTILNQLFSYKDFQRIDRWIKKSELMSVLEIVFLIGITLILPTYYIFLALTSDYFGHTGTLLLVSMIAACVFAVFYSFIRIYYGLRVLYVVKDTKIVLKDENYKFDAIHNYRYQNDQLTFIYEDGKQLKKIQTDSNNVLLVEQVIDATLSLKDVKLFAMSKAEKDK